MAQFQLSAASSVNRWIDVLVPTRKGDLIVERVSGTEQLGRLFEYEVLALSNRSDLSFDDLLGQHLTVLLEVDDGGGGPRRPIDGRIAQVGLLGAVRNFDNLYRYRLVLRPWLWLLAQTQDCRIFQNRTTEAILREVFEDHADIHFDFRITGQYPVREYCVQYRESDFDFISRLLEEDGMYYFFEHAPGRHVLVVCDAPGNHRSVGAIRMRHDDHRAGAIGPQIHQWAVTGVLQPGAYASRDYNFEVPNQTLDAQSQSARPHPASHHEVFDYPGNYVEVLDGGESDRPEGNLLARKRLEEIHAAHVQVEGSGDSREIRCGALFTLSHHLRADQNREHLVVSARVEARNNLPELDQASAFECHFRSIGGGVQYRSPRITRRPIVQGPQTAVVVGPEHEEIHVDPYGRVKVQFHWDRRGEYDDRSSCWVRVSQVWAGKNYGWMTVPRVGQEVVVDFLEGNPDRPLVTGRVYNAEQMPPWALPDNKTRSGILTRSSAGGSPANANELHFEDRKGEELVKIHAERDMNTSVERNDTVTVGNDQTITVDHDQRRTVKNDQFLTVERDRTVRVVRHESREVEADQRLKVGGRQDHVVAGERFDVVRTRQTQVVGQHEETSVPAPPEAARVDFTQGVEFRGVSSHQGVQVGGDQNIDVTGELYYKAKRMTFEAEHIEHKVTGKNSVIHDSPNGPYTIIANAFKLASNNDITLSANGDMTMMCKKYTVEKQGPAESSSWATESSFKMATTNDLFLGVKFSSSLSANFSTDLGLVSGFFGGIKLEGSAGLIATMATARTYGPPTAPAANATSTQKLAFAIDEVLAGAINLMHGTAQGIVSSGAGTAVLISDANASAAAKAAAEQERAEMKQKRLDLAEEALKAGHPNVAARLLANALGVSLGDLLGGSTDSLKAGGPIAEAALLAAIHQAQGKDMSEIEQALLKSEIDRTRAENEALEKDNAEKQQQLDEQWDQIYDDLGDQPAECTNDSEPAPAAADDEAGPAGDDDIIILDDDEGDPTPPPADPDK